MRENPVEKQSARYPQVETLVAAIGLLALCLWTVWRLGGFELMTVVRINGRNVEIPDTFAKVDHPFHATRAATLLDSLQEGHLLRWIGNHQGGYPAEFYPLGIAWLDVGLWAILFGSVPIISVHKLGVILVFVLPALAFWLLTRGDRLNLWVAFLATAIHIAVPGEWTNGGYRELVDWGLVTNVGGATLALIAYAAIARFVHCGQRSMAVLAALVIAAAAYTNPRSLLAVGIAAAAILVTSLAFPGGESSPSRRSSLVRMATIGIPGVLLTGPLLVPLIRYRDLYYFVHYEGYETLRAFWDSTVTAVSLPGALCAFVGVILSFTYRQYVITRSLSMALIGYVVFTGALSTLASPGGVIEQLETPRLMPFQRLVMIYLAAFAIARTLELALAYFRIGHQRRVASGILGLSGLIALVLMLGSLWKAPDVFATPPVETTGRLEFEEYRTAVRTADGILPQGTAVLVAGNRLDSAGWWHEQLWGPTVSDAPFFYDDWLWYWHRDHDGPYNYINGHAYPDPSEALTDAYFESHGIGAVVVTNVNAGGGMDPRLAAPSNSALEIERTIGDWDVYRVLDPTPIVTAGTAEPVSVRVANHEIMATFADAAGEVTIRRNWFPRWKAFADGEEIQVHRTGDGYMQVTVPDGTSSLELKYAVTAADWASRVGAVLGLCAVAGMVAGVDRRWPKGRRRLPPGRQHALAA